MLNLLPRVLYRDGRCSISSFTCSLDKLHVWLENTFNFETEFGMCILLTSLVRISYVVTSYTRNSHCGLQNFIAKEMKNKRLMLCLSYVINFV